MTHGLRTVIIATISLLIVFIVAAVGVPVWSSFSERTRLEAALREVGLVIANEGLEEVAEGKAVKENLNLNDPMFKSVSTNFRNLRLDQTFVLSPTLSSGERLVLKQRPQHIIAWSQKTYGGNRLVLTTDLAIYWLGDTEIDWDRQVLR